MEKHTKNREVVCLLCLDRVTNYGAVIKNGNALHQSVGDFVISDYKVDHPRLPNGLCSSCRVKLQKLSKFDFSSNLPEMPDYSSMVGFRQLRSSSSTISVCSCLICEHATRPTQFGKRPTLSKLQSSMQFTRKKDDWKDSSTGLKPTTAMMCVRCFQKVYQGCRQPCTVSNAIENVKKLVPDRMLQIATQDILQAQSTSSTTPFQMQTRGLDATWVKKSQGVKRAHEQESKRKSKIHFATLDNIRLEAGLSCKKIETVAHHLRKAVPVASNYHRHLAVQNKEYMDLFDMDEIIPGNQNDPIAVVICNDVRQCAKTLRRQCGESVIQGDQSIETKAKMNLTISALVACLLATVSAKISPGPCPPKPETKPDFDATQYIGDWFQVQGIPNFFTPDNSSCIRASYGDLGDGTISVHNVLTYPNGLFGEICGSAYAPNPEVPGELLVLFPFSFPGQYLVLDTDYENWSAVYACVDLLDEFKFEYTWLLTRDPEPSDEVISTALDVFVSKGISLEDFETYQQGPQCMYEDPEVPSCIDA